MPGTSVLPSEMRNSHHSAIVVFNNVCREDYWYEVLCLPNLPL